MRDRLAKTPNPMPLLPDKAAALDWVNEALTQGVKNPGDEWHSAVLAYSHGSGNLVQKTVILRAFDSPGQTVEFYTDTRAAKWAALLERPVASLLLYCPVRQCQLSLQGAAHTADCHHQSPKTATQAEHRFRSLPTHQRPAYQSRQAPGQIWARDQAPPSKDIDDDLGDRYFGIVTLHISAFDFVSLHPDGHQRLGGSNTKQVETAHWLCP